MITDIMFDTTTFDDGPDSLHSRLSDLVMSARGSSSTSESSKEGFDSGSERWNWRRFSIVGYLSPKFEGKEIQKQEGKHRRKLMSSITDSVPMSVFFYFQCHIQRAYYPF
jgi:hypothetical protein